jgi:hypothetical protein
MQSMDLNDRTRRRILYVGGAIALLAVARRVGPSLTGSRAPSPSDETSTDSSRPLTPTAPTVVRLRKPPSATAEIGVLTDTPEATLAALVERPAVAALVGAELCGDEAACAAVRATLQDEHATTLSVVPGSSWSLDGVNLDASAPTLSAKERASIPRRAHVVVVHVATAPSTKQLAVRSALAAAAAIAAKVNGLVFDQLLDRIETAKTFATHAVNAPLDASAFRKDRVQMLFEPKAQDVVRILTAGLARWGAPDVEAEAVPLAAADRVADVVIGVAEAIANGATEGPVRLSRDDLARARGEAYAADPSLPDAGAMPVELLSVHPEGGDPNDFMARILPPTGTGPLAFLDLAERFFGSDLAAAPSENSLRASHEKALRDLPGALAHWASSRDAGAALLVRLPFPIAGDGGTESMWIDVTAYDAKSVTGKLADEPLGATDFTRGDAITRPRSEVEAIEEPDRPAAGIAHDR